MLLHKGFHESGATLLKSTALDVTTFAFVCQPDLLLPVGKSGEDFWSWLRSPTLRAGLASLAVPLGAAKPHSH